MKKIIPILLAMILALPIGAEGLRALAEATPEPFAAAEPKSVPAGGGGWWNILLLGGDSRDADAYGRTDSIIILSVNQKDGKVKMTSILRDTWVDFPGTDESGKINAANVYGGPALSMETVNACFGTDIQDYLLVNMVGLVKIIDQVGGIDIPVTSGERKWLNAYAREYVHAFGGYEGATSLAKSGDSVHLNGLLALSYCRIRYIGNDYQRTQRQRTVLLALLHKLKGQSAATIASVAATAFANVETNLSLSDLVSLAGFGLKLAEGDIEQSRIPADGTFWGGMKDGIWSIRPDFEENAQLLHDFIYGKAQ